MCVDETDQRIAHFMRERDQALAELDSAKRDALQRRDTRRALLAERALDVLVQAFATVIGGAALAGLAGLTGVIQRTLATDLVGLATLGVIALVAAAGSIFTARVAQRTDETATRASVEAHYTQRIAAAAEHRVREVGAEGIDSEDE